MLASMCPQASCSSATRTIAPTRFAVTSRHRVTIRASTRTNAGQGDDTPSWSLTRRAFAQTLLLQGLVAPAWAFADATVAAPAWSTFQDETERFSISVPPGWTYGEGGISGNQSFSGASGTRRVIAWFADEANINNNVTLVITNVGADFTSMGSFGSSYAFGANLVGSMDQSYLKRSPEWARPKGPIQEAKLLDAKEDGGMYTVEYTVLKDPVPQRHLMSRVALGYNGTYNRLYTLTAQASEADWPGLKSDVQQMMRSFKPPISKLARV